MKSHSFELCHTTSQPLKRTYFSNFHSCLGCVCGRITCAVGCRSTVALRCTGTVTSTAFGFGATDATGIAGAPAAVGSWESVGGGRSTRYIDVDWEPVS